MKVWISLCLIWLMVRVVSAQGAALGQEDTFNFTEIEQALRKVEVTAVNDDASEHQRVLELMQMFSSLEELMRGSLTINFTSPLSDMGWSLPRPQITLSRKDSLVFKAMATRYLYPEVRLVEGISEVISERVTRHRFLINRQERLAAQSHCLNSRQYTRECVLESALGPIAQEVSDKVAEEYGSVLPVDSLKEELLFLIERGGAQSALYEEALVTDMGGSFLKGKGAFQMMMLCLNAEEEFFEWQLIGKKRCGAAFDKRYGEDDSLSFDRDILLMIKAEIFNPFSDFQIYMVSLSEEVLNRGVLCRTQSCKERKVKERLDEWAYSYRFSDSQRSQLAAAIAKKWLE